MHIVFLEVLEDLVTALLVEAGVWFKERVLEGRKFSDIVFSKDRTMTIVAEGMVGVKGYSDIPTDVHE
jgi:hypothetical protein